MKDIAAQIPDVWFDVYARFIPGFIFFVAAHELIEPVLVQPLSNHVTFTILFSYCIGHVIQPVTSRISRWLEYTRYKGKEAIEACREAFPADARESRLLSKQHAECASFTALSLLSIIFVLLYACRHGAMLDATIRIAFASILYCAISACSRAKAVGDRANKYLKRATTSGKEI